LLTKFLNSRRQGLSQRTLEFYKSCIKPFVDSYELTPESINQFLSDLKCGNAKHAYFRALRVFCNWATRQGFVNENPIERVDPPNTTEPILPSLTVEQVQQLINTADSLRDKCIISLFADSGMRLSELANILNELVATFPGGGGPATPEIVAEGQKVWQELNAKVDIDGMEPAKVAHEYLVEHGLIKG